MSIDDESGWDPDLGTGAVGRDGVLYYSRYPLQPFFDLQDTEIAERNRASFPECGRIRLTVDSLDVGRLSRNIAGFDESGSPKPVPEPADPLPPGLHRTRWDFDPTSFACAPQSRVLIEVHVTAPRVQFLPNFDPVMTGSVDALQKITDLQFDRVQRTARFWLKLNRNGTIRFTKFNLLLLVVDSDNPRYSVPLVIDPSFPHRG